MDSKRPYLGAGMKFPPQINRATGRFVISSEQESVKESIYLILTTHRTERFLRPEFGSDLSAYTFMDVNITTVNMMTRALTEQIMSQEPRIQDVQITVDPQVREGCLLLQIDYYLINSNVRDNLVFPFYLTRDFVQEAADLMEEDAYESDEYTDG